MKKNLVIKNMETRIKISKVIRITLIPLGIIAAIATYILEKNLAKSIISVLAFVVLYFCSSTKNLERDLEKLKKYDEDKNE